MSKTALITGASRGIGNAVAHKLAAEGYDLYLICKNTFHILEELKEELEQAYAISCHIYSLDAGDYEAVAALYENLPRLDVLINNAGISYIGLISEMSQEEWKRVMDTNLNSVFYFCKHTIPGMLSAKKGRIINISSVWGNVGASMEAAYSASKGGVNAFTKALAKELAPSNIQVNAIACGVIDTDMNRCFNQEDRDALKDEIPADRFGLPEEAADMVYQLIEAPSYLTGQIIALDGGWI